MNKRVKLCLALFLAFAVIVQYSFSPQAMIAYGEDGDTVTATEASDQTEPTQATTAPKPAPEPSTSSDSSGSSGSSDSSDATEPTEATEASDDSDGASDDANTDAEDPTTVEEETVVDEEALEEEEEYPAVSFTKEANGMTIHISAPEGALPEGADVKVVAVPVGSIENAVENLIENSEVVKAVDITFYDKDGGKIEPKKDVSVTFTSSAFNELNDAKVVHIQDNGKAEMADNENVSGSKATFKTDEFSVYAIVDAGEDARLKVIFKNGETEVASMYVKKGDNMQQVLYDPGAGTIPSGAYFRGWTSNADYTAKTTALTIEGVRTEVSDQLPPSADGTEVVYHAMIFKDYRITYFDENNISLGQEEVTFRADSQDASQNYTVNMAYTVQDTVHNFEGWKVRSGGSNIAGYTDGKIYQNNDNITITGNVEFGVNAPEGHWLVFDENGKGAKYNAPQFIHSEDVTAKPCDDEEMTRHGYTFGGWYKDADCTEPFTFGQKLIDYTIIYAKWNPNTEADYTVIIWKQHVSGTDDEGNKVYDFVESVNIEDAAVDSTPTAVNTTTGRVTGATYAGETGFHYASTDQAEQTVSTEGSTIVNVYYDRDEITFNFYVYGYEYSEATGTGGTQYGFYNNEYVRIYYNNGTWYRTRSWSWGSYSYSDPYDGPRYTRSNNERWTLYETMSGLYGSTLAENDYTWPAAYDWYDGYNGSQGTGTRTTFLDAFLPTSDSTTVNFYARAHSGTTRHVYFYTQNASGNGYTMTNDVTVADNTGGFNLSDKYNGFKCVAWNTSNNTSNWHQVGELMASGDNYYYDAYPNRAGYQAAEFTNNLYVYFNRLSYPLVFMNGSYYNGNTLKETVPGEFKDIQNISYGASIASYNKGSANYYEPAPISGYEGYTFAGWYYDDKCTRECTFTTMPEGGLIVYAKWIQNQYRVYLHPNYPDGASGDIDWGGGVSTCFRVDDGKKISEPRGRLQGYRFIGWFTDEECKQVFNGDAYVLNNSSVTEAYDWDVDKTEYDVNGNVISDVNNDKTENRFWIKKKFQIYAAWRSVLDGASGIGVTYDANGGTNPPSDTHTYVDNAKAPAGAASKPSAANKQFAYWVLQTWNKDTGKYEDTSTKVFPGGTFTVSKANAKVEDIQNPQPGGDTKKYTVQLRAEYIETEKPTPTHIPWFKNDGSKAFHIDNNDSIEESDLDINEAVSIQAPPSRPGYTFLGWAKVNMANDLDAVKTWEATSSNWTQNGVTPYLYYANNAFHLGGVSGKVVTQVAADENTPYQAMFGVWEENEVTINYAVASDSTGYGSVSRETETINAASGTAQGSTATGTGVYTLDYWTCDDGTDPISTDTTFVPSKKDGAYEAHTYYAHFSCKEANVTVHHYLKGTTTSVAEDVTSTETVGSEYTAQPVAKYQEKNLTVDSYNPSQKITVSADGNEITIYYTLPLTITAKTDSKTYDGTPLTGEYTVKGALATDEEKIEKALGTAPSITNVSQSPREYQATTTDVPGYYVITNEKGTLTIKPLAVTVTITGNSNSSLYNGADQSVAGYTFRSSSALVKEADLTKKPSSEKTTVTGKDNGTYTMKMTADDFGIDNGNFTVTFNVTPGTLTINKRNVTITSDTDSKVYDGTALTNHHYTITGDGFVERETPSIVVTGSQTEVGRSYNTFTYSFDGITGSALDEIFKASAVEDNYIIHPVYGTLTVTAVPGPTPPTPTPTPDGDGGGPAVAAAAPIVDTPVPTTIDEPAPPKAVNAYWALINLLCTIATALLSLIMLIRYFGKRKDEEELTDPATGERVTRDVEEQRGGLARIASLIPAIGGIIAFLLTEDMSLPMAMVDKWTVLMIVILAIQAGVGIVAKLRDEKDDEDEEAMA